MANKDVEQAILRVFKAEGIDRFASSPTRELPIILERHMPKGALCAVLFLVPYYVRDDGERNISRYAVSRDYHGYFAFLEEKITDEMSRVGSPHFARVMGDISPIDEKTAAISLGLGVRGRNRLLINNKYGSYVFIGEVYTDAEISLFSEGLVPQGGKCSECGACERVCPSYLSGGGGCLSDITQKKKLCEADEALLSEYAQKCIWGCDICQEVCPHNKAVAETPIDFFGKERIPHLTREILDSMDEKAFSCRAYAWRGRAVIERNIEIAEKKGGK